MEQFAICRVRRPGTRQSRGLALVLQHFLLDDLTTSVVAPLVPARELPAVGRLRPKVRIERTDYVVAIDRLAALPRQSLGEIIGSLAPRRDEIRAGIDILFFGI